MDEESSELAEPLLQEDGQKQRGSHSTFNAVFNLSKVIIGAGMMAIPRAYFQVGYIMGTAMLVGVCGLTYYTLAALVRGSAATGAATYSQLAGVVCGRPVMKLLQLAVLAFCFGFGVVYLVIIRDILLGTPPDCNGLLCELLGLNPGSMLADPRLVITAVALVVIAPLLLLRSMDKLGALNVVGVTSIALLAAVSAGLAVQGYAAGTAYPIPALPQWALLGPTRLDQIQALTAVIPVLIACYVAHQSVHPLMPLVQPYSDGKMRRVIAVALLIAFGVYFTLAVGASLVFGPEVQVNVLNDFSVAGLQPLVGAVAARLISWSIRGGYLVSLLASLLLYMHPLRGCLAEMIWEEHTRSQTLDQQLQISNSNATTPGQPAAAMTAAAAMPEAAFGTNGGRVSSTDAANSSAGNSSSNGPFAAAAVPVAADQHDPSPLDDSRVLLAYDSMDQPAFGSWKPGFKFFGLGSKRDSLNPRPSVHTAHMQARVNEFPAAAAAVGSSSVASATAAAGAVLTEAQLGSQQQQQRVHSWQQQEQRFYYPLTYGLLVAMVLVAVLASNIWVVLSAIGDMASTIQAFVVPGLIAVVLAVRTKATGLLLPPQQDGSSTQSNVHCLPTQAIDADSANSKQPGRSSRGCTCKVLLKLQCGRGFADQLLQRVVHGLMGGLVVALGLALFANGIFQRV